MLVVTRGEISKGERETGFHYCDSWTLCKRAPKCSHEEVEYKDQLASLTTQLLTDGLIRRPLPLIFGGEGPT